MTCGYVIHFELPGKIKVSAILLCLFVKLMTFLSMEKIVTMKSRK